MVLVQTWKTNGQMARWQVKLCNKLTTHQLIGKNININILQMRWSCFLLVGVITLFSQMQMTYSLFDQATIEAIGNILKMTKELIVTSDAALNLALKAQIPFSSLMDYYFGNEDILIEQTMISYADLEKLKELIKLLEPRSETGSNYDMILKLSSLQNISDGWEIIFKNESDILKYNTTRSGLIVSSIGYYDTGKTYVINRLLNESFPAGIKYETKGLSMMESNQVVYVDTEGSRRAVSPDKIIDRLVTDYFVQQLALRLSNIILLHIDALYAQDIYI
jgi:hypothetical protein